MKNLVKPPLFKTGDVVRIGNPDRFVKTFARLVKDRDGVVGEYSRVSGFERLVWVEFQQRNGRGKKFRERIHEGELVLRNPAPEVTP